MFASSPIELLSIVVPRDKIEEIASGLVRLGIFQPVDIQKIEEKLRCASLPGIEKESAQWQVFETKLNDISSKLSITATPLREIENLSVERVNEIFKNIDEKIFQVISQKEDLLSKLKAAESMFSQVKDYFVFPIKRNSHYSFLQVNLGIIDEKNLAVLGKSLEGVLHLIYPFRTYNKKISILLVGLKKDHAFFTRILQDLSWKEIEFPHEMQELSKDAEQKLRLEMESYKEAIAKLNLQITEIAKNSFVDLSKINSLILLKKSLIEAKRYSYITDRTAILSGWVLRDEKEKVADEIKKISNVLYVEKRRAEDLDIAKEEVPVQLKHNALFKPFELLINSYGIPRYGTVDPTVFVAITFLFMFGAMFGDLGQGLVLALIGFFLRRADKPIVKQGATLLLYCGLSASVFGIFYGSVFGFEEIMPALLLRPMENILDIFGASILFGIIVITVGIIINAINALRDKDYLRAIFDKSGLITWAIYWLAIAYVSKLFVSKTTLPRIYLNSILVGILLIFLKPIVKAMWSSKKENEGFFVIFMESLVDILEIVMGYLANTVSFIRVAAFSLAHVGLFLAIFQLSHMLKSVAGGALSVLIIIMGNILIILLEGMVVGIQSLRLNYYEFFSKFFMTGKQVYKPLTMTNG